MFRVIKMGHQVFATEIASTESDAENIDGFLSEGDSVVLVNDIEDAEAFFGEEIVVNP